MKHYVLTMMASVALSATAFGYGLIDLKGGSQTYSANATGYNVIRPRSVEVWSSIADAVVDVSRIRSVNVYTNCYDITTNVHFVVTNQVPFHPSYFGSAHDPNVRFADQVHRVYWDDTFKGKDSGGHPFNVWYTNNLWHIYLYNGERGMEDLVEKYPQYNARYSDFHQKEMMSFRLSDATYSAYIEIQRYWGPADGTTIPEVMEWTQDVTNRTWSVLSRTCISTNTMCHAACVNGFISQPVTNEMYVVTGDVIETTGITSGEVGEKTRAIIVYEP